MKNLFFIILLLLSSVALLDLFHIGLPITHDGQDHVARIANFYQNLSEGNIIPRWAANLNWGYGHPILMFLYPLPSYVASLFHFLGFSLIDSVKIVFGLGFIASGIAMYVWLKEFLKTKSAFVGAILYMFAPYRFVDLYVRGAIGEHVAFVFPPLVLYFLLKIAKKIKFVYVVGGSLSLAGLILSHNAITLMFLPLIFLYFIYLFWKVKSKKDYILHTTYYILLGLGLSAFFWVPAFFEGKYTLRDIVTGGEYSSRFVSNFKDFIYGQWVYGGTGVFSVQVGIIHWLLAFASLPIVFILYKKKNRLWMLCLGFLIIFTFTLFLMLPYSKVIWENITTLQKFQFPWRFLSITVFATSVLGAVVISVIPKKFKVLAICFLVIAVLFFNKDYWQAKDYLVRPESFFTGVYYGTTDTGESAPIWSVRFMEKRPKEHIEGISGKASIKEVGRRSTVHVYEIDAKEKSRILENTLYFPGWNVFVDGRKVDIEFQDPSYRGLMTFFVEEGRHNVEVKFEETKLRLFANIISTFTLVIIIFLYFGSKSLRSLYQFVLK